MIKYLEFIRKFFETKPGQILHDKNIFEKSDLILNEDNIEYFLNFLESDQSYEKLYFSKINSYLNFFSKAKNQYINRNIYKNLKVFINALEDIISFLLKEFYIGDFSADKDRKYLHPELNIDRDAIWDEEQGERDRRLNSYKKDLFIITNNIDRKYKKYRKTVKKQLFI